MIWCIKTYIIAYVKTQKNKIHYPLCQTQGVNTGRRKYIILIFNVFSDPYRVYGLEYRRKILYESLLLAHINMFAEANNKRFDYDEDIDGISQD